jgi:hypothetical protein
MNGGPFVPEQVRRFERELSQDPALVERVLQTLSPVPAERERVTVRTDRASVDAAITRALALAVMGIEARIELTGR